jgi:type IV secretory pathway VirB10-like protein
MVVGLLIAAGVVIVVLVALLFLRPAGPPPAPPPPPAKVEAPPSPPKAAPQPAAPAPAPAPPAPEPPKPAPEAQAPNLKEHLTLVLNSMRDARLNKNIIELMNCYSATFPALEEKRRETLKAWELYDYTNMVYSIDEAQSLDPDNAVAKVTWYVDFRNRRTGEFLSATQNYQVRFAKELGLWRIRSLEEIE